MFWVSGIDMKTTTRPIEDLVPQDGDMILIDRVVGFDDERIEVEAEVRAAPLWPSRKSLPAAIGIEYMAQAIAAFSNLHKSARQGGKPKFGLLLGTRNFRSATPEFSIGTQFLVSAKIVTLDEQIGVFDCRLSAGGREVATATVNVFEPKDDVVPDAAV